MTPQSAKPNESHGEGGAPAATSLGVHVRPATREDVSTLVPLVLRLKRLNEEFDPLLKVRSDADKMATEILRHDIDDADAVVLVIEGVGGDKGRVVGMIRARLRERPFYTPEREGVILDVYLLPLYRRHGVGEHLLDATTSALKAKGATILTAEFPLQNQIAASFYHKRGFHPTMGLYSRLL